MSREQESRDPGQTVALKFDVIQTVPCQGYRGSGHAAVADRLFVASAFSIASARRAGPGRMRSWLPNALLSGTEFERPECSTPPSGRQKGCWRIRSKCCCAPSRAGVRK